MDMIIDKQQTRLSILQASYKLLLHNNYEKVTIPDIEKESKLSRGAIFYYFENKQQILAEVVRLYYLKHFYDYDFSCFKNKQMPIRHFIRLYKSPFKRIIQEITDLFDIPNPEKAFCHFTIQAGMMYPEFYEKMSKLSYDEYEKLKKIIFYLSGNELPEEETNKLLTKVYDKDYTDIFASAFFGCRLPWKSIAM